MAHRAGAAGAEGTPMHRCEHPGTTLLTLLALSVIGAGCGERRLDPLAETPPVVEVARPVQRQVADYRLFTARTAAVQSVEVKPRVTGYLTRVNFRDGAEVAEGEVLFEIDDRVYKANLDKAKGDLETQKAALVEAQAFLDIGLATQQKDVGAISKQELDRRRGARDEAVGAVKSAEGVLERARLYHGWCKVTAPIAGRVNRHFVDVGNVVTQDQTPLTNIVSLRPAWAYFDVDQETFVRVQQVLSGGKAPVQMTLGGDLTQTFHGVVDFTSNQVDPNTGSIRMRAEFPNEKGELLAGMFGRLQVPVSRPHQALLVADSAIGTNQGQRYLLVVNEDNEVEYRPVEVGQMHEGLREVFHAWRSDGKDDPALGPNDRVIVRGLLRVRPGVRVEPRLSAW